jgi:hypothetical protein
MYSAGTGESALDVLDDAGRNPNSVYTRHLVPLLKTPGLSLTEVAEQVRVSVRQMAATVQHVQTPAYYNQVLGRVCLAGGDCAVRVVSGPIQPTEAERTAVAKEVWAAAKDTTSIPALEAFVRRFGDTYYGDLAKVRLALVREGEAAARKKAAEEDARAEAWREQLAMLKADHRQQSCEGRPRPLAAGSRVPRLCGCVPGDVVLPVIFTCINRASIPRRHRAGRCFRCWACSLNLSAR